VNPLLCFVLRVRRTSAVSRLSCQFFAEYMYFLRITIFCVLCASVVISLHL